MGWEYVAYLLSDKEVVKALVGGAATVWGSAIVGLAARKTAADITAKIEDRKMESAKEIELQRLKFTAEVEAQRQRMELYKAIYLERITVSKQMMRDMATYCGMAGRYHWAEVMGEDSEVDTNDLDRMAGDLYAYVSMNEWLLTEDVDDRSRKLLRAVRALWDPDAAGNQKEDEERYADCRMALTKAVSRMMHENDVSAIAFPEASIAPQPDAE